ncbi:uncharacterized protein [Solanum lycopersicum]|uniref:uncharacterized protein n=1 Tax=Solanum lycopersicum TaxID=4081 RepID=UPI003747C51E
MSDETPPEERFLVTEAWIHLDFLCKNYILSDSQNDLYNVYNNVKTSNELWDALEKKCKTKDVGMKKFIEAKFLNNKMIDSKTVVTQVQELQVIIHDFLDEGLILNDVIQVVAIIKKLRTWWKDFKNYLKHKSKKMTVEDLIVRLRIEEDNKTIKKRSSGNSAISGVNIVEEDPKKLKKRKKSSGLKSSPLKKKFNESCFNYDKRGHMDTKCRGLKMDKKKKEQTNFVESKEEMNNLCAMLSECNLVGNPRESWIDSGASCHVCGNKELFSSYNPAPTDEKLFMANSIVAKVGGTDKILLKMTSGKVVSLNKVSYVPKFQKNLISIPVLTLNGFKCVFVSDKVVVSKNEMYVGKGYLSDDLLKLNVIAVDMNKDSASSYLLESKCLWNELLEHINNKTLRKLINLNVLPKFECNKSKCQIFVESKYANHPYKSIKRNSNLSELIHIDIRDRI